MRTALLIALALLASASVVAAAPDDDTETRAMLLYAHLYDRGHVDARVTPVRHPDGRVTFDVDPGPVYAIARVEVRGDDLRLIPSIGNSGDRFVRSRVAHAVAEARRLYRERGRAVDVQVAVEKDDARHRLSITLSVVAARE